jgi:hypothetical protein
MHGDSIDTRKSQYEDLEELDFICTISYIFITLSKFDSDKCFAPFYSNFMLAKVIFLGYYDLFYKKNHLLLLFIIYYFIKIKSTY